MSGTVKLALPIAATVTADATAQSIAEKVVRLLNIPHIAENALWPWCKLCRGRQWR
jgi:hypothetical protein